MTISRKFSLGIYLLLVCALSWPFQIAGAIWGRSILAHSISNSLSMVMVTVATFIAGKYIFKDGFSGAGWSWGKARNYLAVIGLVFLLFVLPTLVRILTGTPDPGSIDKTKIIWLLILPLVFLIPGFGEEFGWRGYMLPRITASMGVRKAVLLHAVIWWAWHLPITLIGGIQAVIASAAAGTPVALDITLSLFIIVIVGGLSTILHGVVFAYIWQRSSSLAVAVVYHAVFDGVRDSLSMAVGLSPAVSWWATGILSLLGILLLWRGNWSNMEKLASSHKMALADVQQWTG